MGPAQEELPEDEGVFAGQPLPGGGRMLLQEMPACQLDLLESSSALDSAGSALARELPLDSDERKLAMLDAAMSYHNGRFVPGKANGNFVMAL